MESFLGDVLKLKKKFKKVYIYGAGLYGRNIYEILKENDISIDGFIVTKQNKRKELFHLPIYEINKVKQEKTGIIVGVNRHNVIEIKELLRSLHYNLDDVAWGNRFIEGDGRRGGMDGLPTIEITTKIGCTVNCQYCPQKTLVREYYKENPKRESVLSLETFRVCLDKLPDSCDVIFCGMSEPFLNCNCIEMIETACASGRNVDLYTTLVGISYEEVQRISELPFNYVVLHLADRFNYAHIPVTEEYYAKVKYLLNHKKVDGSSFVDFCNAQAEVDDRLKSICKGKYHVFTALFDRAGNLKGEGLLKKDNLKGMLSCSQCGKKVNHNILLPDGTMVLCCMDYGMKHILGNLKRSSYEEVMNGKAIQLVRAGMAGDEAIDILCRNCSCANQIGIEI